MFTPFIKGGDAIHIAMRQPAPFSATQLKPL